ncbi:MAG: sialidase family protein [Planctomycetota bacterium]|jgi:hypothetical protein
MRRALERTALVTGAMLVAIAGGGCGGGGDMSPFFVPNFLASDVRVDTDPAGAASSEGIRGAVDGLNVYCVWSDARNGGTDIYFNRSTDGGATWQLADLRLDTDLRGAADSADPQLARSGRTLFVVWEDSRSGGRDIYLQRSDDAGVTWLVADVRLDSDAPGQALSEDPVLGVDGSTVHVAWEEERDGQRDVYYRGSTDGGVSFRPEVVLNTAPGASYSDRPRLAVSGSRVYVAWKDNRSGAYDIHLNASADGGLTWLAPDVRVETGVAGASDSNDPEVTAEGENVYVVWSDARTGNADIRLNRSSDGGQSWLIADIRIDTDPPGAGLSIRPQVRCTGGTVYVVWVDARDGNADIRFNRSLDAGRTWQAADQRLDTDAPGAGTSEYVRLEADGPNVYVAWQDDRDSANDIRFNYSTDQGATFLAQDLRCDTHTTGLADSTLPRIASDGTNVYVLWADRRDGQSDVYCRPSTR